MQLALLPPLPLETGRYGHHQFPAARPSCLASDSRPRQEPRAGSGAEWQGQGQLLGEEGLAHISPAGGRGPGSAAEAHTVHVHSPSQACFSSVKQESWKTWKAVSRPGGQALLPERDLCPPQDTQPTLPPTARRARSHTECAEQVLRAGQGDGDEGDRTQGPKGPPVRVLPGRREEWVSAEMGRKSLL